MQWRTPITLAVLVVILLGAAYYGWQTVVDPVTDSGTPTPPTTTRHTQGPPPPRQVCVQRRTFAKGEVVGSQSFLVNVYNAGGVSGRAGDVLAALHNQGFRLGVAANPPPSVTATNVTILTSTPNSPRIQLVKEQFKGVVKLLPGPELATGVDVIIGPAFLGLAPSAPTSLTLKKATVVCTKFVTRPAVSH